MLAQESAQRRAPGFRPGTLLQGPRAGGAELATLRFAQTSSAFSRPENPSARGSIREAKVKTERIPMFAPNHRQRRSKAPGARPAGAARNGRGPSVPKMSEKLAILHWHDRRDGCCLDLESPVVVAPSGEGFRGEKGAGCLSGAEGVASSAPPAKNLGARETPARAAGRGRGSRACFLGTSLHEQRSPFLINNGRGALASQRRAVCGPKAP